MRWVLKKDAFNAMDMRSRCVALSLPVIHGKNMAASLCIQRIQLRNRGLLFLRRSHRPPVTPSMCPRSNYRRAPAELGTPFKQISCRWCPRLPEPRDYSANLTPALLCQDRERLRRIARDVVF